MSHASTIGRRAAERAAFVRGFEAGRDAAEKIVDRKRREPHDNIVTPFQECIIEIRALVAPEAP